MLASILDGIFKPISDNSLSYSYHIFQMASISPFLILPTQSSIVSNECKFLGTLVFNHLPPSDHKRQTIQSNSSGLRRLNRGSRCTPKFSIPFSSRHLLMLLGFSIAQGYSMFDQTILILSS